MKKIVILGAGISGLSLGWYLKRRFGNKISLQIAEKTGRPGGWIQTVRKEGFLFEQGPRSLRSKGAGRETLKLLEQLDLREEIIPADRAAHHRYLWTNQRLFKLPSGPAALLGSSLIVKVLAALVKDLVTPPSDSRDESIYDFISRRFGSSIADDLIDPLVSGIYAGDIRKLSLKSCFPLLHEWEQRFGSVIVGGLRSRRERGNSQALHQKDLVKSSIFTLKSGLEALVHELSKRLDEHIIYSQEVKAIRQNRHGAACLLENGGAIDADRVFSTIPANALGNLLADLGDDSKKALFNIPAASVAVVNVGFHRTVFRKKGFGYLVPSKEKEKVLGVVWDSTVFPGQNLIPEETRLTVMIGGDHMRDFGSYSEGDFLEIAKECLSRHLGVDAAPDAAVVKIARHAIPQYLVGHSERVRVIEDLLALKYPKIAVHGNSYLGVSVNDCIARSKQIEESLRWEQI